MKVGDVVRYDHQCWRVASHAREFRTCILCNFDGLKVEIPDDLSSVELRVLYNPITWPFVSLPVRPYGRLMSISRSTISALGDGSSITTVLTPMEEWIPSDFLKSGGSVFFNPRLKLRPGEILVATYENQKTQRIAIPRNFVPMSARKKKAEKKAAPLDNYQRILGDDVFGED